MVVAEKVVGKPKFSVETSRDGVILVLLLDIFKDGHAQLPVSLAEFRILFLYFIIYLLF